MNKKKLVAGLLASASVLGVCLSGGTAFAAHVQDEDTTVGIGFGEHINPPGGDLQIQWLPRELNFGSGHKPDAAQSIDYVAEGNAKKYVVVSDARADDVGQQWTLTGKLSELKDGGNALKGATLKFNSTLMGYTGNKAPEDAGSVIAVTGQTATVQNGVLQAGDAATSVMEDNTGTSSFKGKSALEMSDIKLSVPGGAALENKTYTGTVTWSLSDEV